VILIVQILLVALVAGIVLYPLVAHRGQRAWAETRLEAKRRTIGERKERLYGTIVELDFDRDSGKLSAADHARLREEAMKEVLGALAEEQEVDAVGGADQPAAAPGRAVVAGGATGLDSVERLIEEYKQKRSQPAEVSKG
jgi:cytochrome c-type biogenesis protein CcmI